MTFLPYILIVEDDCQNREMYPKFLKGYPFRIETEQSCMVAARKIIIDEKPDLLVLDVMNEDFHGQDLLELLIETHNLVPAIVISGTPYENEVRMCVYYAQRTYTEQQRAALGITFNEDPKDVFLQCKSVKPIFLYKPIPKIDFIKSIEDVLRETRKK
jgi:CheY-like chemotaxis protein